MTSSERQKRYMAKLKAAAGTNANDETTSNDAPVTNDIDIPTSVAWWKRVGDDERTELWVSLFEDDDWNTYIDECVKLALEDWGYKKIGGRRVTGPLQTYA
jgi:hypothetical protein